MKITSRTLLPKVFRLRKTMATLKTLGKRNHSATKKSYQINSDVSSTQSTAECDSFISCSGKANDEMSVRSTFDRTSSEESLASTVVEEGLVINQNGK